MSQPFCSPFLLCLQDGASSGAYFVNKVALPLVDFKMECDKVEIALRAVRFLSPASRSCDFVITRLISDQIALQSVQLPLLTRSGTTFLKSGTVHPGHIKAAYRRSSDGLGLG